MSTIVKLGENSPVEVATFEEAFGEHSEFKGRAKARQEKRRAARQEKKLTRVARKGEKKTAKQQMRSDVAVAKQGRKANKMQAKQQRKFQKKDLRLQRQQLGQEEPVEEQQLTDTGDGYTPFETGGNNYAPQDQYQEGNGGGYVSNDEYEEEQGGGYEETPSEDEGGYEEYGESEDYESGDDTYGGDESEDFFDGQKVCPCVQAHANKVEWNNELISRLRKQAQQSSAEGDSVGADIKTDEINDRIERIVELASELEGYANCEGEFVTNADGDYSYIKGKTKGNKKARRAEVTAGRTEAKKLRAEARQRKGLAKQNGGDTTKVDANLNPVIETNRIEVPSSEFAGTGLTGLDNQEDYDAPEMEKYSFATGKKINWLGIGLGVGAAVVAIILINKFVIKKK